MKAVLIVTLSMAIIGTLAIIVGGFMGTYAAIPAAFVAISGVVAIIINIIAMKK